jgi:putative MATE family efflux protein
MMRLAAPVFVANAFQALHSVINIFWLGRLPESAQALNAPVISFQILFLAASMAIGLGQAGTSLVGQARGARQEGTISRVTGQVMLVMAFYFCLVAVGGILWARPILRLLNTPSDAIHIVMPYFKVMVVGMLPISLTFAYRALAQGVGDTKTPMLVDGTAIVLNMILDPLLIFGLGLGAQGAALATLLGRLAAGIWALRLLTDRNGYFRLNSRSVRPDGVLLRKLARIGLPAGLAMGGSSLGFAVITRLVASHGSVAIAAFGVATRLFHLFMLPSLAAISAVTTAVAQCLGAGMVSRARRAVRITFVALPTGLLIPIGLLMIIGKPIASAFANDPEVAVLAYRILLVAGLAPVLFGGQSVLQGAFQGGGVTVYIMVASFLRLWGVRVPFSYLLVSRFGLDAVWASMVVSNLIALLFLAIGYSRGIWERRQVPPTSTAVTGLVSDVSTGFYDTRGQRWRS